jgi:hypothetical protein
MTPRLSTKISLAAARAPVGLILLSLATVTYGNPDPANVTSGVSIAEENVEEPIGEPLSEEYADSLASAEAQAMELALPAIGIATLSWTPPTQTLDGSSFRGIASYRIDYGLDPAVLERTIEITNPGITTYVVEGLMPGVWYFRVTAFDTDGNQSLATPVGAKVID